MLRRRSAKRPTFSYPPDTHPHDYWFSIEEQDASILALLGTASASDYQDEQEVFHREPFVMVKRNYDYNGDTPGELARDELVGDDRAFKPRKKRKMVVPTFTPYQQLKHLIKKAETEY